MHHPPLLLGIPAWDAIGLCDADRAALGDVVAGHPHVRRIVAGHVHRAALGSVGGCPVFTCPSTWIQGRLDFAHPDELSVVAEPPGYAVHVAVAGELTYARAAGRGVVRRPTNPTQRDDMSPTFVIVGAGMAGGKAARRCARRASTGASCCSAPSPSAPTSARR